MLRGTTYIQYRIVFVFTQYLLGYKFFWLINQKGKLSVREDSEFQICQSKQYALSVLWHMGVLDNPTKLAFTVSPPDQTDKNDVIFTSAHNFQQTLKHLK